MKNKDVTGIDVSQEIGRLKEELAQKNRELQIETALERVRSRAINMDKSDELIEVVHFLNEEIKRLGIIIDNSSIITDFGIFKKGLINWIAAKNHNYMEKFHIPYIKHQITTNFENAIKKNISYYSDSYSKPEKDEYFKLLFKYSDFKTIPKERQQFIFSTPGWSRATVLSKNSVLIFQRYYNSVFTIQEEQIFKQFGKVFEQAYTRFLDLQKAEAHAREAEIQLALERVRAGAMAMHKSEELSDTASILFQELNKLGLNILRTGVCIFDFDNDCAELWLATEDGDKTETKVLGKVYGYMHPMYRKWIDAGAQKKKYFQHKISGNEVPQYYEMATSALNLPKQTTFNKSEIYNGFFFPEGSINIISLTPLTDEECEIGHRFANVFGLLYRRFLDLQKAEAQAREARIEAALEKVRARTMAMYHSSELAETTEVLYQQLIDLGIGADRIVIGFPDESRRSLEFWMTPQGGGPVETKFTISFDEPLVIAKTIAAWKSKKKFVEIVLTGKALKSYLSFVNKTLNISVSVPIDTDKRVYSNANFSSGLIQAISSSSLLLEDKKLLERFAAVFDLTYTRFLDLQKAEAQAREAQIEAALERVRTRTMAMQASDELGQVVSVVYKELAHLGIDIHLSLILIYDWKTKQMEWWSSGQGMDIQPQKYKIQILPEVENHPWLKRYFDAQKNNLDFEFYELGGEIKRTWDKYMLEKTDMKNLPEDFKQAIMSYESILLADAFMNHGVLSISVTEALPDQDIAMIKRFAKVIDLTFSRFYDLKKAEAQAREAIKQASLDRVRGEIASMRKTDDLNRITPLIWKELTALDVPFIRCGVFIMDNEREIIQTFLSTPDGKALSSFDLHYDSKEIAIDAVKQWRKNRIYQTHWDSHKFVSFMQGLINEGKVDKPESFQGNVAPPESLYLNFIPFKQGMLYVGDIAPLSDDHIDLVKTLAEVFSIAYSRYEDFKNLEAAKNKIEITLNELKAAQTQLIQAEKMASLGELTAGIAHEIQNPLNFVNNFSEVSSELLSELKEEIEKGDMEEVKIIVEDVIQNLEKILNHGRRADGIVKSMLQHSRGSGGEKLPTDINVLADEYLRLSYHGFRAKDKSFNADFKLEADENLPKINVIPQDIGRVLLNLINNAFFAVNEKTKMQATSYKPQVSVTTSKMPPFGGMGGQVKIVVQDNGPGIPSTIKEKIFQPFFTTKPTGSGTGLGLSLSYDIVKAHGGEIKLESTEGQGTKFIIQLPI